MVATPTVEIPGEPGRPESGETEHEEGPGTGAEEAANACVQGGCHRPELVNLADISSELSPDEADETCQAAEVEAGQEGGTESNKDCSEMSKQDHCTNNGFVCHNNSK